MKNVKCKISHVKDRKKKNQIFDVWEQNCLAKNKTGGKPAKNYLSMSDTCCKNLSTILQAVWLSSTVNVKRDNFRQCQNPKSTLLIYKTPPAKTECFNIQGPGVFKQVLGGIWILWRQAVAICPQDMLHVRQGAAYLSPSSCHKLWGNVSQQ